MSPDQRDLLAVLQTELDFLQRGGYRRMARAPWRAPLYFEDSPTCPRLAKLVEGERPCSSCVLFQLVPKSAQDELLPCRHIPLNEDGYTLHTLYRCGTPLEIRAAFEGWLSQMIEQIETKRIFTADWNPLQLSA
jgi:hypothetical protein